MLGAGAALAESPNLGRKISEADVKQWDIAILPDGSNLPPGQGTPAEGAKIFAEKCAMCHGDQAKGGVAPFYPALVGGQPLTNGIETPKTIANYYAFATTIFDYIAPRRCRTTRRARSPTTRSTRSPPTFSASNKLIGENDVMDAKTLPQVKMPNRDNFILPYPDRI